MECEKIYPGIRKSFLLLVLFLVLHMIVSYLAAFFISIFDILGKVFRGEDIEQSVEMIEEFILSNSGYISIIALIIPTIIIGFIIMTKRQITLSDLLFQNIDKAKIKMLIILTITTLLILIFNLYISSFLIIIFNLNELFTAGSEAIAYAISGLQGFLLALIVAPIAEEIIFRGLFLEGIASRHSAKKSIFTTAFMFSIFHMNLPQLIPSFILGLFLGYVYIKTKSLILCIYIHFVNNIIPFVVSQIDFEGVSEEVETTLTIGATDIFIFISFTILLFISLLYLKNYFDKLEDDPINNSGESLNI
ncbi:CPBP family intramembrane glutamic endopeptidase [Natronospora cellulosivora (SeqCode)]